MSYTKANLADVGVSQAATAAAGSAAAQSAERSTALSAQMESGIDEVTAVLLRHVQTLADSLRQQAAATGQQLAGTDWEGRAREAALAAEQSLHARVDATMAAAEEGTAALRGTLTATAGEFLAVVQQDFSAVLAQVDVAYLDLAAAQAAFAESLIAADMAAQFA